MWLAICDDEKKSIHRIFQMMEQYVRKNPDIRVWMKEYKSPKQFLLEYDSDPTQFDVIFLDILFGKDEINGMELARKIRESNPYVYIIFLTVTAKYAMEGYEVGAYRYLIKPVKEEIFETLLDKIRAEKMEENKKTFTAKKRADCQILKMKDIFYIECKRRKTVIYTIDEKVHEHCESISKSIQKLDERFFVCHRGYIINLDYLSELVKTEVILSAASTKTGKTHTKNIPVSRNRKKNMIKYMMNYYAKKL